MPRRMDRCVIDSVAGLLREGLTQREISSRMNLSAARTSRTVSAARQSYPDLLETGKEHPRVKRARERISEVIPFIRDGLADVEIADRLGISVGAVEGIVKRARDRHPGLPKRARWRDGGEVERIVKMLALGITKKEAAKLMGISETAAHRLARKAEGLKLDAAPADDLGNPEEWFGK